ncbi:MAG: hypothetical protein GX776_09385 [Oxalobacter sp.]|nr:hypothetical protein [Oxalobacter sp.]
MRKTLFLSVLVFFLSGCASMKANYIPAVTKTDWPELNKPITINLGEDMLVQKFTSVRPVLTVKSNINGACHAIPQGRYLMIGEDDDRMYFDPDGSEGSVTRGGSFCAAFTGIYVPKNDPTEICIIKHTSTSYCFAADLNIQEMELEAPDAVQRYLLYSGKEGKHAKLVYMERQKGEVRLTHTVTYNLDDASTFSYGGAELKITKITNNQVTYTVSRHFQEKESNLFIKQRRLLLR